MCGEVIFEVLARKCRRVGLLPCFLQNQRIKTWWSQGTRSGTSRQWDFKLLNFYFLWTGTDFVHCTLGQLELEWNFGLGGKKVTILLLLLQRFIQGHFCFVKLVEVQFNEWRVVEEAVVWRYVTCCFHAFSMPYF